MTKLDGDILSVAEKVNNNSGPDRRPRLRLCEWTQVAASANCCLGPSPRCSGITTSSPLTSPPCCYDKPRHCRSPRLSAQPTTLGAWSTQSPFFASVNPRPAHSSEWLSGECPVTKAGAMYLACERLRRNAQHICSSKSYSVVLMNSITSV